MQVYADNAATTRMHQTAIDTMTYHLNNTFGNPSSLYTIGQQAKEVLETARAAARNLFYLRRQRGRQSGYYLRRLSRRAQGQKAHYFHHI